MQFESPTPSDALIEKRATHLIKLLKTISTHLPAYLVDQIIEDPTPGQTGGEFVSGTRTLLFADISGFTALSEKLSRIGQEGAEEITRIVNDYFRAILNVLAAYDGQLVKFGGDALLGLFPKPNDATRAVQAALQMQTASVSYLATHPRNLFPTYGKLRACPESFGWLRTGFVEGIDSERSRRISVGTRKRYGFSEGG